VSDVLQITRIVKRGDNIARVVRGENPVSRVIARGIPGRDGTVSGTLPWSSITDKPIDKTDFFLITSSGQQVLHLSHLPLSGIEVFINGVKQLAPSMSEIVLLAQDVTIPATHLLENGDQLEFKYQY
jgi:hypothetical protein